MHWYTGQLFPNSQLTLVTDDPGLLYGATVFTTLRVYQSSLDHPLTAWAEHCDRLQQNFTALNWTKPNWTAVRQGAELLSQHFPVLRITVFWDGREWITGRALPTQLLEWQQQGVMAWVAPNGLYQRSLPQQKTGNYLTAWIARQQALQQQAQEAILTNAQGDWLETSTGNLWAWGQGQWWTPPVTAGLLPGIARSQLLNWLAAQGQTVCEAPWTLEQVQQFEAIAYSNSVVQVVPFTQIRYQKRVWSYAAQGAVLDLRGFWGEE